MKNIWKALNTFIKDDSGQNLIEYALVAGIIGLGAVVAMTSLKNSIVNAFSSVSSQLANSI
jgi:pilus assembly protein Flp/PilA